MPGCRYCGGRPVAAGTAVSRAGTGSSMVNWVPLPSSLCTEIRPPWASMILRVVGRPKPEPPCLVEKKASKIRSWVFSSIPQPVSIRSSATPVAVCVVRRTSWPPSRHGLLGIEHQIDQGSLKRFAIQHHAGQIGIEVADHLDARSIGLGIEKIDQPQDQFVQIARLQPQRAELGEIRENRPGAFCSRRHSRSTTPILASARRSRGVSAPAKSSANSSMFSRMVDSGFLISWASAAGQRGDLGVLLDEPAG